MNIMEIIFEAIFNFLMIFPGAFIRWVFSGFKRKYIYYVDNGTYVNVFISGFMITILVLLFNLFI